MRIKIMTAISVFCMIITCIQCGNKPKRKIYDFTQIDSLVRLKQITYYQIIDTIEKKVVDLTYSGALYDVPEFLYLYENPEKFQEKALVYMADSNKTVQQKMIALYSVQKLPSDKYINFASQGVKLYTERKINEQLVQLVIASTFSPKTPIIKNSKNKKVIDLLNIVKNDPQTSSYFKEFINKLLLGDL